MRKFDRNSDGKLSDAEILAVEGIECQGKGIQSLKGIEVFTALKRLLDNGNRLTEQDVSPFPDLEVLEIPGNQLTALDVCRNPRLQELQFADNQLSQIDPGSVPLLRASSVPPTS